MNYSHTFYDKSSPVREYADNFTGYELPASTFGFTSDPRTANQLDAVSKKLNTGTKVVEVSGVNISKGEGPLGLIDYIPKQHFKELNRLKKLAGAELTFHAPLVEPTGLTENGWNEHQRKQVEREVLSSVQRAHELDPSGNVVVTFHTSNGLPEPEQKIKTKDGEVSARFLVIDERTGRVATIRDQQENFFEKKKMDPSEQIEQYNKENWSEQLGQVTRLAENARISLLRGINIGETEPRTKESSKSDLGAIYKYADKNPKEFEQVLKELKNEDEREVVVQTANEFGFAKRYASSAYLSLKEIYNQAYEIAEKDKNKKLKTELDSIRDKIAPRLKEFDKDPDKLREFIGEIGSATRTINSAIESAGAPRIYKPLKEFAIDKASETFANAAFDAYKEFGSSTPIFSLENPPAGSGINRAEDIKELVEAAHDKFVNRAMKEKGMSENEARKEAEKIIGVTWDVGHINMIKKFGYDDKDLKKQTEKIAKHIKHIHLSDNFGMAHTELPMGMGNVPIKEHEEVLKKQFGEKMKQIKQIVETGGWFADFKTTPFRETMGAFGSPLYPMQMASYWKRPVMGSYFAGYGRTLPDVHFQTYGAGFSNLPIDLGGEMQGRSRVSGTPTE